MTVEILVQSRFEVESRPAHRGADHAFISIRTPGDPEEVRLPLVPGTVGVLHMSFHDLSQAPDLPVPADLVGASRHEIDARALGVDPSLLFGERMAIEIVGFARLHAGHIGRLIVHCDAGMSRSPAVAAALARSVFGQSDEGLLRRHAGMNQRVYRCILAAAGASDPWAEST